LTRVRARMAAIDSEGKVVSELRKALSQDGWTNENARLGDYSSYQDSSTVDSGKIAILLSENEFITESGRWWSRWAKGIINLRNFVKVAVHEPSFHHWKQVHLVLEELRPAVYENVCTENSFIMHDFLFADSFREFVAARREFKYQSDLAEAAERVESAIISLYQERSLAKRCTSLNSAIRAYTALSSDSKAISAAETVLDSLHSVLSQLNSGLTKLDRDSLTEGIQSCASLSLECTELLECTEAISKLNHLNICLERRDVDGIRSALLVVLDAGLKRAPLVSKAQAFWEASAPVVHSVDAALRAVRAAKLDQGVSRALFEQLVEVQNARTIATKVS